MIAGLNAGLSAAAYLMLPARWAVTAMAGAYSVALFAGFAVTAYALHRRLTPVGQSLLRSPALRMHGRLLLACLPASALGYAAARAADGAGDIAAACAGTLVLAASVLLLARPLGLTGITATLTGARRRLRR